MSDNDQLEVLLEQESTVYMTWDYLYGDGADPNDDVSSKVTPAWREKICEWCYQVVDHFGFDRQVVCVALNYLDRYLASVNLDHVDRRRFQLLAMSSLLLATKLYEHPPVNFDQILIQLSRGFFTVEQLHQMENSIFQQLQWRLHPPTPLIFLKFIIPKWILQPSAQLIHMARYLTEVVTLDYFFVNYSPSQVAMASLLVAIEQCHKVRMDASHFEGLLPGLEPDSVHVEDCRSRLYMTASALSSRSTENRIQSPVSVMDGP